jgi:uncharacterized protein (TIGR02246 family)|tara:strand:- start:52575 stop:52943 length:369 start_codon:yes stop_codon:yes gene_type:complete
MTRKIPKIIQNWADSIEQRNPKLMTNFYSRKAILLATYESMLLGRKQIRGYFDEFLDKKGLRCRIRENYTQIDRDRDTRIASGIYEFTFMDENKKKQRVIARYSYVINSGKIINHHSSVNPE